ncbi:S8 family peptidase [bacterium SCSIO 12741]|nr:S8 family peptidase [bacterium SCSIO 12741]
MKKHLLALALLVGSVPSIAQQNSTSPVSGGLLLNEPHESSKLPNGFWQNHIPHSIQAVDGEEWIGVTLLTDENFNPNDINALQGQVGSELGEIVTVRVPVKNLDGLKRIAGIRYIEVDMPVEAKLDKALPACNVPQVHDGTGLSAKYSGKGVVVGVIDYGFDFTHPTFLDTSGNSLRVKRAWIMGDQTGTPPAGQIAGSEITDPDTLWDYGGTTDGSHGTHVAGIAGGSGYPDGDYTGVAYESDLVLVELDNSGSSEIINGIKYIFDYAAAQGKPAVVNMSLGSHLGPHDGTSLLDQAIDNMVGPGKIVVGASGNEGSTQLHIGHSFGSGDTVNTWPALNEGTVGATVIDIWGEKNESFSIAIGVIDTSGSILGSTGWITVTDTTYDGLMDDQGDTAAFEVAMVRKNGINDKPSARIEMYSNSSEYFLVMGITGPNGKKVDLWNHGTGLGAGFYDFVPFTPAPFNLTAGDTLSTMGEIGGTAKDIITVGAYTSKTHYTNIFGQSDTVGEGEGELALFSSLGPTADGRVKPDITAPGHLVVSAVNSYDQEYLRGGPYEGHLVDSVTDGTDTWYYGQMSGTSMATPMTTGIIALWLQADENLDPNGIKDLLNGHSIKDQHTGSIPSGGNNFWGRGKIDALAVMTELESYFGISEAEESEGWTVYPNPTQGEVTIKLDQGEVSNIQLTDLSGRILHQENQLSGSQLTLDLSDWNQGLYLLSLSDAQGKNYAARLIVGQ